VGFGQPLVLFASYAIVLGVGNQVFAGGSDSFLYRFGRTTEAVEIPDGGDAL
ncbi:MAG: hypothetical protein H6Q59_3516, partial [Firmicutes bacterium]|nr:hypothetical protein [Bacillota bacterium]